MINKIETQKYIINRLDNYIESSQNKSNLYLALNTIILGGVITLISTKVDSLSCILNLLLGAISILSLISIIQTLRAINPYLKKSLNKTKSIFFFKDIAECSIKDYQESVLEKSKKGLIQDLAGQSHILAKGLTNKYNILMISGWLIGLEFFLLFCWIIIFLTQKN